MRAFSIFGVLVVGMIALAAGSAHAQTITQVGSGVEAFFGSVGTGYQDSSPVNPFTPVATAPLYAAGAPLVGPPAPPTPMVYPTYAGFPFQATPSFSGFSDSQPIASLTTAKSVIGDVFNPSGPNVADQAINIPYWNLSQAAGASLWAYEQLNFAADYQVLMTSPLLGGGGSTSFSVTGTVVPGGSVQFDAAMTYTWSDINTAGLIGSPTILGTLTYQWNQTGGGAFSQIIAPTGTLSPTPFGSTAGILEITGYAFLAGDPFEITVAPEPASLALLALGALVMRRRAHQS